MINRGIWKNHIRRLTFVLVISLLCLTILISCKHDEKVQTYFISKEFTIKDYEPEDVIERARAMGYTIEYKLSCENISDKGCENARASLPLPEERASNKELLVRSFVYQDANDANVVKIIAVSRQTDEFHFYTDYAGINNPYTREVRVIRFNTSISMSRISKEINSELKDLGLIKGNIWFWFKEYPLKIFFKQ